MQATLQRAVDADPGFALAWIALARACLLHADLAGAREAAARARSLAAAASAREQGHVNALALAIEGRPADALAATRDHLAAHPRDALVLAPATMVFGLIGFSGRQAREDELHDWLRSLAPHYGSDWWFETVRAFAECETGRLADARGRIERSLAANPRNAHGAHVLAHVLHESGETAAVEDFLADWLPRYDRHALMHCHLSWHAALASLALGHRDRAWQAYRGAVHPGAAWGPPLNVVTDAASFLWRAALAGEAGDADLWRQVSAHALACFPATGVSFADVHVALACAAAGDPDAVARIVDELHARLAAGTLPAGEVVPLLAQGFAAFAAGDWPLAVERLERALPAVVRIGGSRAQREIVAHTLIAACAKAGLHERRERLVERLRQERPSATIGARRPC